MASTTPKKSRLADGKTARRRVTRGPNKGDIVLFKGSPSGKPFPVRVIRDVGSKRQIARGPKKGRRAKVGRKGKIK